MAQDISVALTLDNSEFQQGLQQSQNSVNQFTTASTKGLNRLRAAFAAVISTATLKSIIQVGSKFQDLEDSLNAVFGSTRAGAAAFDRIQKFSLKTQFGVDTLTEAFIQLKGAGVEPTEKLLMTFADAASVTTDQMGTFQAALDLVSRSTAGGLGLEDLNRLADRGIPVFQILEEKLNLARLEVAEFGRTAEGANTIITALVDGLDERFGGTLLTKMDNVSVKFSNMQIAAQQLAAEIFMKLEPAIAKMLDDLTTLLTQMSTFISEAETMRDVIEGIEEALGPFADLLQVVVNVLGAFVALKIIQVFAGFVKILASAFNIILQLGVVLVGFGKNITGLGNSLVPVANLFKRFFLFDLALSIVEAFKMLRVMDQLGYTFRESLPIALKHFANRMIGTFLGTFRAVIGIAVEFKDQIFALFSGEGFSFKEIGKAAMDTFAEGMEEGRIFEIPEKIREAFESADIFGNLPTPPEEVLPEELPETMATTVDEIATQASVLDNILAGIGVSFENLEDEIKSGFLQTLKSATQTLSDSLAESLMEGKSVLDSFRNFFKTMVKKLISDALRLLVIQPILSSIFGLFFPGQALNWAGGVPTITPKAKGGPVGANQPYLVGEEGPELFVPGASGNIVPNNRLSGMGGEISAPVTNNYITNNINALDSRSVAQVFAENRQSLLGTVEYARKETAYGV